jgi:hypothetical protein
MIKTNGKNKGSEYSSGRRVKNDYKRFSIRIDHTDVFRGKYKVTQKQKQVFYEDSSCIYGYGDRTYIRKNDKSFGNLCFNLYQENNNIVKFNLNSIEIMANEQNVKPSSLIKPMQTIYELKLSFSSNGDRTPNMDLDEGFYMHILITTFVVESVHENHLSFLESNVNHSYNQCYTDLNGLLNVNGVSYYSEYEYSYNHNDENIDLSILETLNGLFV